VAELNDHPVAQLLGVASDESRTIVLCGELDAARVDGARAVLDEALKSGPQVIRFEMGDLSFMDSSGLAVLVHAANRAGRVVLGHPSELIRRVLEVTGLSEIFEVEP
jgi:anti-sigma B factor antagonist